jgi:integrase
MKRRDLRIKIDEKSGLEDMHADSNPTLSARKQLVFEDNLLVWHQTVAKKFKYARLIHHDYDLSKRWYVLYYAWNVATEKMERVRLFEPLNRIKRLNERITTGEQMVRIVNGKLDAGKVLGKEQINIAATDNPTKLSLLKAIEWVKNQKEADGHRKSYVRTFQTVKNTLEKWLNFHAQPDFPIRQFNQQDARSYFQYLRDELSWKNKTINNTIDNFGIALNYIQKDKEIWKRNPLQNISSLPVITQKHAAYSDEQITTIKSKIAEYNTPRAKQLQLFISFIYYVFIRPNEAVQLRVHNIDLKENRLMIKGLASKTKFDEYVELPLPLRNAIIEAKITSYPQDYFVFGLPGEPDIKGLTVQTFWKLHRKILKKSEFSKFDSHFTLYSYKHSGVISLYKLTKDIKRVQRQCRHKTLEQTNTYLRDLGLLTEYDQLQGWQGAV